MIKWIVFNRKLFQQKPDDLHVIIETIPNFVFDIKREHFTNQKESLRLPA